MTEAARVRRLDSLDDPLHLAQLCDVLIDCVDGGASVSFMHPLAPLKAEAFWRAVADGLARLDRVLLVAQDGDQRIVGTVQLVWAQAENQPHRGEVSKMLVHRSARRRGIGAALMTAAEQAARDAGRSLLVLDTADGAAARLYERLGWQRCGTIPGYALWPGGGLCATTVYFKALGPPQNV